MGALIALSLNSITENFTMLIIPFAAGNFIYIAGSDLIPELLKDESRIAKSLIQLASFILGIFLMFSLKMRNPSGLAMEGLFQTKA